MKTTLTVEESARLIELGVDAKLASYEQYKDTGRNRCGIELTPELRPVFTLTDILSILPKDIDGNDGKHFPLAFNWDIILCRWNAHYTCATPLNIGAAPELIDALNQLLIWIIEQGHLKTEEK